MGSRVPSALTNMNLLLIASLTSAALWSVVDAREHPHKLLSVPYGSHPGSGREFDVATRVDVNEIDMYLTNAGGFGRDLESPGEPAGTFYPRGTDMTCLYTGGLWVGGMAPDGLRVTVAEYDLEYQPGRMLDGGGWTDPALPQYRVYKLTQASGPGDQDYDEWPVGDGAPVDGQGSPLRAGDQTLWSVFNDANPDFHNSNAGGTLPIGIEVSHLSYAYDSAAPLDRVIVMDYRVWHRGTDPIDDAILGIWLDVDLGEPRDDLVGCDSLLGLAYVYNDDGDDVYGLTPPAVGVTALSGPESGGHPAYAATDYVNGTDPSSAIDSYNYMRGLERNGEVVYDPTTGRPTRYWHSGDPATGLGWIDLSPTDKRSFITLGPLDLAPGQIESLRVAFVIGQGEDWITSVADLQDAVRCVRRLEAKRAFPQRSRWAIAGFYPDPFDPSVDPAGNIFVLAPEAGTIEVVVLGAGGAVVRRLLEREIEAGILPVPWDGRDDAGDLVPPGAYRFHLRVLELEPANVFVERDVEEMVVRYDGGLPPETAAVGEDGAGARHSRLLRGSGWISVATEALASDADVALFDVHGRAVRGLVRRAGTEGVWWDGRDERGGRAPAGIYFIQVEGSRAGGRVLLMR